MTRKHTHRRAVIPQPPRGLRKKLTSQQVRDLSLVHHVNLDAIAKGDANELTLWHAVAGALTWSRVATMLRHREAEMVQQLAVLEALVTRYGRTGRILFTGPEYQLAKAGVQLMDDLAELVDEPTALAAADWSEARIEQLKAAA